MLRKNTCLSGLASFICLLRVFSSSSKSMRLTSQDKTLSMASVPSPTTSCSTCNILICAGIFKAPLLIIFSRVVLPMPFLPIKQQRRPNDRVRSACDKRVLFPKATSKFSMTMSIILLASESLRASVFLFMAWLAVALEAALNLAGSKAALSVLQEPSFLSSFFLSLASIFWSFFGSTQVIVSRLTSKTLSLMTSCSSLALSITTHSAIVTGFVSTLIPSWFWSCFLRESVGLLLSQRKNSKFKRKKFNLKSEMCNAF